MGDLLVTVRESARRKTVGLGIERDGQLLLLAPAGTSEERLAELVNGRRDWLYAKQAEKAPLAQAPREREYVNGEGFWYAGRKYRLKLTPARAGAPDLALQAGRFALREDRREEGRAVFVAWYRQHLQPWLEKQVAQQAPRVHVPPRRIQVLDLGYRWGSCSRGGTLSFHWRLALLPRRMAEYVVMHELVHLEHLHHREAFWGRLGVLMPDYEQRKAWLARHGGEYGL